MLQVPLDGVIVHGRALVSAEHITGESLPSLRRSGDEVPAGALCHDGVLAIKALREARNSTPARIAQLARDAQAQRPQLRTWLDTFGEIYSKAVIVGTAVALCAMLAAGVPFGGAGAERGALYRAMSLLTVASPCALVMVPLAYVSAIAAAASRGVLLKGGRVLDALYGCRVIAVDKTGTLTTGRLALRSCILVAGADGGSSTTARRDALAVAAALSLRSSHPVSDAVVQAGDAEGVNAGAVGVADFVLVPGGGVSGTASLGNRAPDLEAEFGSIDFIAESLTPQERSDVEAYRKQSGANSIMSVLLLKPASSANGNGSGSERSVWALSFADTLQGVSVGAVEALQEGSWAGGGPAVSHRRDVVMLTGDNTASAAQVAGQLGIHKVFAGLSPEEKLQHVASLRAPRRGVMMVGDGLNDAAALAAADVGVAIASPMTAAATLASDAVLMRGAAGIAAVPLLLRIARATRHVIRQNLVLAAGSIVALALPAVLGFIPLWVAVMLHEGSTLLVALNSLRLLRFSAAMQQTSRRAEKDSPAVAEVDAAVMQESLPVPA